MNPLRNINAAFRRMESLANNLRGLAYQEVDPWLTDEFDAMLRSQWIFTQDGEKIRFTLNDTQEIIWEKIRETRQKKLPGRFIILKARREGVSTLIEELGFTDCLMRPYRQFKIVAHDQEGSDNLFHMIKRSYQELPEHWRESRPVKRNTQYRLDFMRPHYSSITRATANRSYLGSSEAINTLHLSEVAKYKDPPARDAIVSVQQCVPPYWDSLIIKESTAYGKHNYFHEQWELAEKGKIDFIPLFFPWQHFKTYFLPLAPGQKLELTEAQRAYKEELKLSDERMNWWLWKKRNDCNDDEKEAHQEYPGAAKYAFKYSGLPYFDPDALEIAGSRVRTPLCVVKLEFTSPQYPLVQAVEEPAALVRIWEFPEPDAEYVCPMDPSEGAGGDYCVLYVLKVSRKVGVRHKLVAAVRNNHLNGVDAAVLQYQLGTFYNTAFIGTEKNTGAAALHVLERGELTQYPQILGGYPNQYYHTHIDKTTMEETERLGWITSKTTKDKMLAELQKTIIDDSVEIYDADLIYELEGFCLNKERNRPEATSKDPETRKAHDDTIMCFGIGLQLIEFVLTRKPTERAKDGSW